MEFNTPKKQSRCLRGGIKKNMPKFPDVRGICIDTTWQSMVKLIANKYDDFVREKFEKLGYTIEELQSGRHKLYKNVKPIGDGEEIHQYFVDDICVLEVTTKYGITSENF